MMWVAATVRKQGQSRVRGCLLVLLLWATAGAASARGAHEPVGFAEDSGGGASLAAGQEPAESPGSAVNPGSSGGTSAEGGTGAEGGSRPTEGSGSTEGSEAPDATRESDDPAGSDEPTGDSTGQTGASAAQEPSLDERLDALITEVLEAGEYRESSQCLWHAKFRDIDIVNEEILLFSRRGAYWINKLRRPCVGLKRRMVMTTITTGVNSYCANDLVFASFSADLRQGMLSNGRPVLVRATCSLGKFEQISEQQAEALTGFK